MSNNEMAALLERADLLLERVSVCGDSVFALAEARRVLKKAYYAARQPEPEHEYKPEA